MASEIPSGSVIITPDDMWRTIQETRDIAAGTRKSVDELKVLVNPALNDLRDDIHVLDTREQKHHEDHDAKILALQQQSWSSRWVPALVMSLLCTIGGGITLYILTAVIQR